MEMSELSRMKYTWDPELTLGVHESFFISTIGGCDGSGIEFGEAV
jgi:hypothetical protein